jgi:hypothetical protein
VRLAPSDAGKWHVDPSVKFQGPVSNSFQQDFILDGEIDQVHAEIVRLISKDDGFHLAGDLEKGHATYVIRTSLIGYPDYVSLLLTSPTTDTTKLSVLSRSRFGRSDFGVNKKRITGWIRALRSAL